jgi:transposase InsO family protein
MVKSESFKRFKEFRNEVEIQIGKSIKILWSDQGDEYFGQDFQDYLKENKIISQQTLLRIQ